VTIGEKQELLDELESLPLHLSADSYDAVVAAAFGGVTVDLPSTDTGKSQFIRLHPLMVFAFCSVLFCVQLSCLLILSLSMDMGNVYGKNTSWDGFSESPDRQMILLVRTIMVIVLQIIGLKELLASMRPIFLLLNPYTWILLVRPADTGSWLSGAFKKWFCLPICVLAKLMQLMIACYVLTVSMSILFIAKDVKSVIFNGLVVTFLADLDEYAWVAMTSIFHMDKLRFENFRFKVKEDPKFDKVVEELQGGQFRPGSRRSSHMGRIASLSEERVKEKMDMINKLPENLRCEEYYARRKVALQSRCHWVFYFWHGKGGKSSVTENMIVFTCLVCIYIRQLFMYVQCVHTGIVPVARNICQFYRGLKHPAKFWRDYLILYLIDTFTIIDYMGTLKFMNSEHEHNLEELCFKPEYMEGPFDKAQEYIEFSPTLIIGAIIVIIILFFLPQIVHATAGWVMKKFLR
jgi:hypothetical protein